MQSFPLHLFAAVATSSPVAGAGLLDAAQAAAEMVPGLMSRPLVAATMVAATKGQDLSRERRPPTLDWSVLRGTPSLEGVVVHMATSTAPELPDAVISITFPGERKVPGGGTAPREAIVAVSMQRVALPGATVTPDVQRAVGDWLLATAAALDATAGFLTLDTLAAGGVVMSPYEVATARMAAQRDFTSQAWNCGWGVLVGAGPAGRLDAAAAAGELGRGGGTVLTLGNGALWLQASELIEVLNDSALRAVRHVLGPVLPAGLRTIDEYRDAPPLRL